MPGDRHLLSGVDLDAYAFALPVAPPPTASPEPQPADRPEYDRVVAEAVECCYGLLRAAEREVPVARAAVTGYLAARWGSLEAVVARSAEVAAALDAAEALFLAERGATS